ncbi:MAG TPA: BamA/TamA family outer membrane protein [Longimicrobium sp.]|nr:BamA/TamA family outer membrane protein [Longimicrobium sp.]
MTHLRMGVGMRAMRLAAALLLLPTAALAAQRETARVVAGEQYRESSLHEFLFGSSYRDLWTTPVRVPVLDPDTLGGLRPTERGGGNQTISLRFRAGNGREYAIRLAAKRPGQSMPPDLQNTVVHDIVQDQISSTNPAGALMVDPLLDAVGVLHVEPGLFVMPDHPFLGEFRAQFAGQLGLFEERPGEEAEGAAKFAGAQDIEGSEDLLEKMREDPAHRPDLREYAAARLMDVFIGDWDRHADQWRWARFDEGGLHRWRPIPRDRDYAFVDYDGFVVGLGRGRVPQVVSFGGDPAGDIPGLTYNAQVIDRILLGPLPSAAWDSIAQALRARLTDPVIDAAVARLPEEYRALRGEQVRATLRQRRELLPEVARAFYARLSTEVELHATERADFARITRREDGTVEVALWSGTSPAGEPYLRRVLVPAETREVRVWLRGGNDHARVEGAGAGILVRVLGGDGNDVLEDAGRGGRTAFYDEAGQDRFARGAGTVVDTRPYVGPEFSLAAESEPPRDWGVQKGMFTPYAVWKPYTLAVVGAGPSRTRYGFRRFPYASFQHLRLLWAPLRTRFGVEFVGRDRWTGSDRMTTVLARASDLEATAFYGYGNESESEADVGDHVVYERQLLLEPGVVLPMGGGLTATLGGTLRWTDPDAQDAVTAAGTGITTAYLAAGARAGAVLDQRDHAGFPRSGLWLGADGGWFPLVSEDGGGFGRAAGEARAYLSLGSATLAGRAGGRRVWGDGFPLQYAAALGGLQDLRGYDFFRFTGDAAAYGGADLRLKVTRMEIVSRGDLGVFALADAGRVWYQGESAGDWHTATGGGLFFSTLENNVTAVLTYARGDRGLLYLSLGFPF